MNHFSLTYKPYGERSILIEWPSQINENTLNDVLAFKKKIVDLNNEQVRDVLSAYNSLLVVYDDVVGVFENQVDFLKSIYSSGIKKEEGGSKVWKIPVCYDEAFGIDLVEISKLKKLPLDAIIKLHSETIYTVYFVGFLPGFLYLGGLNETLFTPRKSTPRLKIKKGAVAIGGQQTGVYPSESPGGWQIIGSSPIDFFNVESSSPCFASSGDRIKFYPITIEDYHAIKVLVENNSYKLESEVLND